MSADSAIPPLVYAVQLAERKEVHVTDADGQMLLVAEPGTSASRFQSVTTYDGKSAVCYTNHHEDGTVKEFGVIFGDKMRYEWTFRVDGSLETSTTYVERGRGRGIVRFFDAAGKPTGETAQTWLRHVD